MKLVPRHFGLGVVAREHERRPDRALHHKRAPFQLPRNVFVASQP